MGFTSLMTWLITVPAQSAGHCYLFFLLFGQLLHHFRERI
ncbi:hypothetical protein GCHA_2552 [Paraglaciecola chathamensis S18K6]|uniref:Uncharacterized protein n=1 Tax=Paraglaciecola chathamensis S18K6 TaxID=1127672 RepID=A0AAV3V0L0_9ALTE|nr:hypothetical protein GCHA_2552 [Paraglaciecola chathamensis S18K6]